MHGHASRVRFCSAVTILVLVIAAIGCGENANPASPSALAGAGPVAVTAAASAHPSPAALTSRGWSCFTPPVVPVRTVCSPPNQGFPTVSNPPPADRPATFTFWQFDASGLFSGTELLIRTDL